MSQRQMAAVMGVSPRTVGRWLREGQTGGVSKIPREARDLVNIAFEFHKDFARDAALDYEIPFSESMPVYAVRKPLMKEIKGKPRKVIDPETGEVSIITPTKLVPKIDPATGFPILGDRIFVENAQFLDSTMRQIAIIDFAMNGQMVAASVGSTLNLMRYYQETLAQRLNEQRRSKKPGKATPSEIKLEMRRSFETTFGVSARDLELQIDIRPVYTKQRTLSPEFDIEGEVKAIEEHIRNKHEPATGEPGTAVGHTIIVQMKRESTNEANARIAARKAAKNQGKRRKT